MQHDSNLQTVHAETSVSNAVLTPEQIHPNFFKMKKTHPYVQFKRQSNFKYSVPLSTYDVEHRKRWALRQMSVIANMPSTAVLGA
ncbi:hypothetical protein D9K79_08040 [Acinetobacter cumulans]|uniref:Uncharacterized protein n=1 Tax=Acinetobacter cumulans TaxID=2136182 RepID=A0ABX9U789_9GAMM|nr:hypothetical protein [Acinetobacter cumulans]RLL46392.1 hypothetical protein D9K79_08040 [Acinetobacter cumulans]